jgi:hypothetical protein
VKSSSVLAIQVFDQKKFKRKSDQGFLGVVNLLVGSEVDLADYESFPDSMSASYILVI